MLNNMFAIRYFCYNQANLEVTASPAARTKPQLIRAVLATLRSMKHLGASIAFALEPRTEANTQPVHKF